ncbi:MptD family putative ECF transporter S component [Streptococcus oricebi]|nr:MptD family putative ECF transporter S component [Streptococcus oricebi]
MTKETSKQTALFALSYFLMMTLAALLSRFVDQSGAKIYAPALTAIFGAIPYFYFVPRIARFGAISLVGLLMGSFFLLTGHIYLALLPGLIFGLLADGLAYLGSYQKKVYNQLSMLCFSFVTTGPILLMWLARDSYIASLVARGKSSDYINHVLLPTDARTISSFLLSVLISGAIGALLGSLISKYIFLKPKKLEQDQED